MRFSKRSPWAVSSTAVCLLLALALSIVLSPLMNGASARLKIARGTLFINGIMLSNGVMISDGIAFGDGAMISDGGVISDIVWTTYMLIHKRNGGHRKIEVSSW